MDQKTQFIADYLRRSLAFEELCKLYGISRKTGYKWVNRYLTHGPAGLEDQPRRPRSSPTATREHIVVALLEARQRHPSWGGKKILTLKSVTSVPMAASAGAATGSTSPSSVPANTSAWKRLRQPD